VRRRSPALIAAIDCLLVGQAYANSHKPPDDLHTARDVSLIVLGIAALLLLRTIASFGLKATLENALNLIVGLPLCWLAAEGLLRLAAVSEDSAFLLILPGWLLLFFLFGMISGKLVPGPVRRVWEFVFNPQTGKTHGSAHFGRARQAARHLAPAAHKDAFVLGVLRNAYGDADRRFRQDGHILTCAPTGAARASVPSSPICSTIPARLSCSILRPRILP
jgi:hypothetical protein